VNGLDEARQQWLDAGLAFPEVPASLAAEFHRRSPWAFATDDDLPPPYALGEHLRTVLAGPVDDSALLAHAGHGVSSWAVHWYLCLHPVAIFVQSQWGNADASPEEDADQRATMAHRFEAAGSLARAAAGAQVGDARLVVVASDFHPSGWGVLKPGVEFRWTDDGDPFAAAEAWLRS